MKIIVPRQPSYFRPKLSSLGIIPVSLARHWLRLKSRGSRGIYDYCCILPVHRVCARKRRDLHSSSRNSTSTRGRDSTRGGDAGAGKRVRTLLAWCHGILPFVTRSPRTFIKQPLPSIHHQQASCKYKVYTFERTTRKILPAEQVQDCRLKPVEWTKKD